MCLFVCVSRSIGGPIAPSFAFLFDLIRTVALTWKVVVQLYTCGYRHLDQYIDQNSPELTDMPPDSEIVDKLREVRSLPEDVEFHVLRTG